MAETLVKFKSGSISDLAAKKTVNNVEYPTVPLDSGTVYFAVDTENIAGQIVYDYALEETGLSEWNANTTYSADQKVSYNGKNYKSFVSNNKGHVPYGDATSYDYWREIVTRVVMGSKEATASNTTPLMNGTAAVGSETSFARGDHVHPTDTSRAAASHSHALTEITGTDDLRAIEGLTGTSGLLKKTAANTWALDTNSYITGINSSDVTSALGFTPYNSTNPNGYISSYTETDPVFAASAAHGITSTDITNWNNKQDAETGKGLSTNDYTTAEKNKLAGIASGAEANVQSNWNETNSSSDAYIQNKPTAVSAFTNDAGYLTSYTETDPVFSASAAAGITSSNISTWNGKQDALVFNTAYNASSNKVATMSDVPTAVSDLNNDANYMSGMTILSYGSSTWNDFITAYTANHVVYCRASSQSNPASGSQTRMAFMAYVSNTTNPTSVEFQYYRSISSHSDSQQGDQVYVYKLTNANSGTWTVETREAYTKVVAGTNMTSSYSNGTLTLNASSQAPTITNTLPSGELIATINSTNIYTPSYTAGTGISITNGVISLNLTQAESENF